jgi:hypothetical protein
VFFSFIRRATMLSTVRIISARIGWTILLLLLFYLALGVRVEKTFGAEEAREITLTGINNCQACGEAPAPGGSESGAKCSIFGHTCTFSIEKALDAEGKEIEELKKKELSYKLDKQSLPLVKDKEYMGARLEVKGRWLKEKGTLEVSSFRRLEK